MFKKTWIIAVVAMVGLTACLETDTERGLAGAAGGAIAADAMGGNAAVGAVVGGAGGVFCDDLGICRRSR